MKTILAVNKLGYKVEYGFEADGKISIIVNGNVVGLVSNMEQAVKLTIV